jgi:hypothetical protein
MNLFRHLIERGIFRNIHVISALQVQSVAGILTEISALFEVKRWMKWIFFKQSEVCIGKLFNTLWQVLVIIPEV